MTMRRGLLVQATTEQLDEILTIVDRHTVIGVEAVRSTAKIISEGEENDLYRALVMMEHDTTMQGRALAITALHLADGTTPSEGFPLEPLSAEDVLILTSIVHEMPSLRSIFWSDVDPRNTVAMTIARMFVDPAMMLIAMRRTDEMLSKHYAESEHQV